MSFLHCKLRTIAITVDREDGINITDAHSLTSSDTLWISEKPLLLFTGYNQILLSVAPPRISLQRNYKTPMGVESCGFSKKPGILNRVPFFFQK